jgi:hypothetical protein
MKRTREDLLFIKEVGVRAAKHLQGRNIRLWTVFRERCKENGARPEWELGKILLEFSKSIINGEEDYANEILGTTVRVSALAKKRKMSEDIEELLNVRKKLKESAEPSATDKMIQQLVDYQLKQATTSPISELTGEKAEQEVVIDDNLLYQMTPEQLDLLSRVAEEVKQEKVRVSQMTVDEVIGREEGIPDTTTVDWKSDEDRKFEEDLERLYEEDEEVSDDELLLRELKIDNKVDEGKLVDEDELEKSREFRYIKEEDKITEVDEEEEVEDEQEEEGSELVGEDRETDEDTEVGEDSGKGS